MSRARRAPSAGGTRVGGGRLRVDAARAVHKLRDYQLADPAMWALEAVRAAVVSRATAVHLDGDSDDVWVAWEGSPIDRDALPRLLDELVSPEAADERRALRLLATAVNTALGLGPRWVDVYSLDDRAADAPSVRARYTPDLLREGDEGAAEGLRELRATEASLPAGAPAIERGGLIHLRRFPALEALSLLATGQEPRELRLARRACEDLPIPLRIARGSLELHHARSDLLRVRLDPRVLGSSARGGGREGFVAIVDPSVARAEARIDFAELGVVLATQPLAVPIPLSPGARLPIRARVDAPRLPTNASRSAIRREDWIARVEEHVAGRLGDLIARLARELGPEAEAAWDPARRERLRGSALMLVSAWCAGPLWREQVLGLHGTIPATLEPLLDVELARDACGRARSLRSLARAGSSVAYAGSSALSEELAPWIGDVAWVPPGDPLALLWSGAPPSLDRELVKRAEGYRDARARWLAKPILETAVRPRPSHLLRVPLAAPGRSARSCVPPRLFERPGLRGELALDLSASSRATVVLLVDGRETETVRTSSALAYDCVATASDLTLAADHGKVASNEARAALLAAVDAALVVACEAVARRLADRSTPAGERASWDRPDEPLDPASAARIVRVGVRLAVQLFERHDDAGASERGTAAERLLASKSPLLDAPAWPTVRGELRSLAELARAAGPARSLGYVLARPADDAWEPRGRTVLFLDAIERDLLAILLRGTPLVDHARLARPIDAARAARELRARCVGTIELDEGAYRGAYGWRARGREIELLHGGREVAGAALVPDRRATVGCVLRVDDDRIVPATDGTRASVPSGAPYDDLRPLDARLAIAVADGLLGRPPKGLHAPLSPAPARELVDAFLLACRDLDPSAANVLGRERIRALRDARVLPRAFSHERASFAELVAPFGGELVYLPPDAPGLAAASASGPLVGWSPLLAEIHVAEGLGRLFQARVRSGAAELGERLRRMRRDARLETQRRKPARGLSLDRSEVTVRVGGQGLRGLLGYDRHGPPSTRVELLLEERAFATEPAPLPHLVGVVDVDPELLDDELLALTEGGLGRVRGALRESAAALIAELASRLRAPIVEDEPLVRLIGAWLDDVARGKRRPSSDRAIAKLREAPIFPTLDGGTTSITAATRERRVRFAPPVDRWLAPAQGEAPSPLDEPILALSDAKDDPIGAIVHAISAHPVRNVAADVRRLLAKRRVAHGLAQRPRLSQVRDPRFRWTLEELAKVAAASERESFEALGLGELALRGGGDAEVELFEGGIRTARVSLDLRPAIALACEPTGLPTARGAPSREALERAVRVVLARAIRHLLESEPHGTLPGWVRDALRESALLGGRTHLDAIADVPVFGTTDGRWLSLRELEAQVARSGALWVTSDLACTAVPLDAERVAVRIPQADATRLALVLTTVAADEELRLDGIARRNLARPPVAAIGPSAGEEERAIAVARISPSAREPREAVVLALHPGQASARAAHFFRDRRPLGTAPDPAAWPALSWLDDPRLSPDRTWSAPRDDEALREARAAIVAGAERAIDALFALPDPAAPDAPLAAVRVDRTFSVQALSGRDAQVRGVLWIEILREPGVELVDAHGASGLTLTTSRGVARAAELPLGGRLILAGVAGGGASSVLESVGAHAYERMVRAIGERLRARRSPAPELDLAELVRATALGFVGEGHLETELELPFLEARRPTLGRLARAMVATEEVLLAPEDRREHARALGWAGPVLIDDGSLAARRAIVALGERVVPLERALADRVLDDVPQAPTAPIDARRGDRGGAIEPRPDERGKSKRGKKGKSAPSRAAPPPSTPPPPRTSIAHPAVPILEAHLRETGAARGRAPSIRVDPLASVLAAARPDGSIELGAKHFAVAALAGPGPLPREALAILAAHVLGVAVRGNDDAALAESHAIFALLGDG